MTPDQLKDLFKAITDAIVYEERILKLDIEQIATLSWAFSLVPNQEEFWAKISQIIAFQVVNLDVIKVKNLFHLSVIAKGLAFA